MANSYSITQSTLAMLEETRLALEVLYGTRIKLLGHANVKAGDVETDGAYQRRTISLELGFASMDPKVSPKITHKLTVRDAALEKSSDEEDYTWRVTTADFEIASMLDWGTVWNYSVRWKRKDRYRNEITVTAGENSESIIVPAYHIGTCSSDKRVQPLTP